MLTVWKDTYTDRQTDRQTDAAYRYTLERSHHFIGLGNNNRNEELS